MVCNRQKKEGWVQMKSLQAISQINKKMRAKDLKNSRELNIRKYPGWI